MRILGIDLGTTNSACSFWNNGKSELIPNRLGEYLTPSVVGIDDNNEILVGETAKHRLVSHPNLTASVFKRYMGSEYEFKLDKRKFTPVELSSLVLRSLKEDAEAHLGESITQAVISVPAYFNDTQRKATKLAAELAGLNVERLINEPTAAAMVYGLHEKNDGAQFLILDMGGGTFDVSLVEYFSGVLEVHASSGDNFLGGEDFLTVLVEKYCIDNNISEKKLSLEERHKLYEALNNAKHHLTYQDSVTLKPLLKKQVKSWMITRDDFLKVSQPLLHRIQNPIERTLSDASISPYEIDEVVLVGGSTRIPMIKSLVSKMFRRMPAANIDPDLVVAMGVGIQAGLKEKQKDLDDVVLTDVCPYTLGIGIVNHADKKGDLGNIFMPIIERNSTVPISIVKTVGTASNNQDKVKFEIYQGESRLVKNNVHLGEFEVSVPKGPAGKEAIDVRYSYDMNGLLEIDVTIVSTGKTYHETILNTPGNLSEKEIEASKEKLSKLKFHPRQAEKNRMLMARAEKLYEGALGDSREYLSRILSEFDQVLESQNNRTIETFIVKFEEQLEALEKETFFS